MNVTVTVSQTKLAGYAFLLLCIFWGLLFLYAIHSMVPYNPIKLPFEKIIKTHAFLPQGWKFFTRSPREEIGYIYTSDANGHWVSVISASASPSNFFGMSRASRTKSVELGNLLQIIKKNNMSWSDCKESWQECADKILLNGTIINNSPVPDICGEVVISRRLPVPWAWSTAKRPVIMPSTVIKTNVLCQ